MSEFISVKNVSKVYNIFKKEPGLIGGIKTLISRKMVCFVNEIP
ncbi:hypothetical protein [Clostridium sp. C8-1-8]|nr:hypothetical protein [Clostridium sp. C8-1-8]